MIYIGAIDDKITNNYSARVPQLLTVHVLGTIELRKFGGRKTIFCGKLVSVLLQKRIKFPKSTRAP